jgi:cytochrome P450
MTYRCTCSDTSRAALVSALYFLCKIPQQADKLRVELQNVDTRDANALALLPHLNGVVNEALRLFPSQLTGGGRITGPEGLWLDDVWIPGGVKVTAPKWVAFRRECSFESS